MKSRHYIRLFCCINLVVILWFIIVNMLPMKPDLTPSERKIRPLRMIWSVIKDQCDQHSEGTLTADSAGSLENSMCQYATLWAVSKQYSLWGAMLPSMRHTLVRIFSGLTLPQTDVCVEKLTKVRTDNVLHYTDMFLKEVTNTGVVLLEGNSPGIESIQQYRSEISKEFKFSSDISTEAQTILRNLGQSEYIGVHVSLPVETHPEVMARYYNDSMDAMRTLFPKAIFVVAGDEEDWTKDNLVGTSSDTFWVGHTDNPELDMATLASCNHSIISVDLFGFWTGFLAGGMVILPSLNGSYPLIEEIRRAEIPGWIFVDVNS